MRHLILMRHAKTEPWHEGIDDAARTLTERGRNEAALVGNALKRHGLVPDTVLLSSARRTRETWAQMAALFPGVRPRVEDGLYLADADDIADFALSAGASDVLLLIGHNPGLHGLVSDLLRMGGAADTAQANFLLGEMPTGLAAVFDVITPDSETPYGFRLNSIIWGRELAERPAS
jgi:phosphohistidine phosphatase